MARDRWRIALRRLALPFGLLFALALALPALAADTSSSLAEAGELARSAFARLGTLPPFVFFGVMALVCVLPVPVSAFYVGGAAIYGPQTTLAWVALALAVNIWLGQTLAARALRPLALRLLAARKIRPPELRDGGDALAFVVLVRIAPGVPFFAQNLVLGLANVDRLRSLAVSLPIQLLFASGFVLLGQSAFEGRLGVAALAVGLIGSVSLAARLVYRRLAARALGASVGHGVVTAVGPATDAPANR
ncbi:MAG: hypothetical protein U0900_07170 [Myxococcota bacterium]